VPLSVLPLFPPWQITAMPSGSARTRAARATARPARNACNTISPAASKAIGRWYGCATESWGMEHSRANYHLSAIAQAGFGERGQCADARRFSRNRSARSANSRFPAAPQANTIRVGS
jgi:hypothetical protein